MLSDRGTFSAGHLLRLQDIKCDAICSVPWADVQELFTEQRQTLKWNRASYLSIEQQRRRDRSSELPQEDYEIAVQKHDFYDSLSKRSISTRVIFVFSTADQKVVRQQRQKQITRIQAELEQLEKSVAIGRYNDLIEAVKKRIARAMGDGNPARYFSWSLTELTTNERKHVEKVAERGSRIPTHSLTW